MWWYDAENTKLGAAFNQLEAKKQFGVLIRQLCAPVERLGWLLVPVAIVIVGVVSQRSNRSAWVIGISLAVYILGGMFLRWNSDRRIRDLEASIRRGAYGFAVMWEPDVEWLLLKHSLPAHLDLTRLMKLGDPEIDRIIANYLINTSNERRTFRVTLGFGTDNKSYTDLNEAATVASQAIYNHVNQR